MGMNTSLGNFKKRTSDPKSWPLPHQQALCYNPKRKVATKRFFIMSGSNFREYTDIEYFCLLEDLLPETLKDLSKYV